MKGFKKYVEDKDPCWKGYEMIGMKKKGGKEVPNCVPKESVEEEVAANNIGSGNIASKDIQLYKKKDKRLKYDTDNMFRRNNGIHALKKVVK